MHFYTHKNVSAVFGRFLSRYRSMNCTNTHTYIHLCAYGFHGTHHAIHVHSHIYAYSVRLCYV